MKRALWLIGFVVLAALTQVGGIALFLAWLLKRLALPKLAGWRGMAAQGAAFAVIYAALTVLIVPPLAALGGRVQLPCFADEGRPYAAATPMYCVLNRNYAVPRLAELLDELAGDVAAAFPGTVTLYLDASFPFLDGFPMLPHLSHDDGRKLDLAFWYGNRRGAYLPGVLRSPIGYGAFEQPRAGEKPRCEAGSFATLRWDLTPLQLLFRDLPLEEERTRLALSWLFREGRAFGVERVFVEPHLAQRLEVSSPLLGFQGCRAARHDDHIHVQIKP